MCCLIYWLWYYNFYCKLLHCGPTHDLDDQVEIQGLTLTVVCWPLAHRNNTLASGSLEKLAILTCRNSYKHDLVHSELFEYVTNSTSQLFTLVSKAF